MWKEQPRASLSSRSVRYSAPDLDWLSATRFAELAGRH
jgi:hypothetical protein